MKKTLTLTLLVAPKALFCMADTSLPTIELGHKKDYILITKQLLNKPTYGEWEERLRNVFASHADERMVPYVYALWLAASTEVGHRLIELLEREGFVARSTRKPIAESVFDQIGHELATLKEDHPEKSYLTVEQAYALIPDVTIEHECARLKAINAATRERIVRAYAHFLEITKPKVFAGKDDPTTLDHEALEHTRLMAEESEIQRRLDAFEQDHHGAHL